jgi:hypothetical protein
LCCLFFFDIRFLVAPLVSSNSSWSNGQPVTHCVKHHNDNPRTLVKYWTVLYQRGNQKPYIEEEQTTQWPKEKVQKDKQRSTKHTYKTKDRVTRTLLKTGGELRYSGRISSSWELVVPIRNSLIEGTASKETTEPRVPFGKAKSSLRKFYGRHHDLVDRYGISVPQMTTDIFYLS